MVVVDAAIIFIIIIILYMGKPLKYVLKKNNTSNIKQLRLCKGASQW